MEAVLIPDSRYEAGPRGGAGWRTLQRKHFSSTIGRNKNAKNLNIGKTVHSEKTTFGCIWRGHC